MQWHSGSLLLEITFETFGEVVEQISSPPNTGTGAAAIVSEGDWT